jgi:hypothetical protein
MYHLVQKEIIISYYSILYSGSALFTDPATSDPYGFLARNSEKVTSTHYFVRIKNAEYNFSNNPSYVSGSVGQIAQSTLSAIQKHILRQLDYIMIVKNY